MKKTTLLSSVMLLSVLFVYNANAGDKNYSFTSSETVSYAPQQGDSGDTPKDSISADDPSTDSISSDAEEGAYTNSDDISVTSGLGESDMTEQDNTDGAEDKVSFHQGLKKRFIEGGPVFMGIVLLSLILGLAVAIERILFLNLSTTNVSKLVEGVEEALSSGGVESAKDFCRDTSGPVASIFYQGLDRLDEGIEAAEKAVIGYGGVQMGLLEKNISWLSLFIALAPMLGFMGTVIGMIEAFDQIQSAGTMEPSLVAGGIKVALLTTVFGLIVAIILQIFYNYIIAKVDSIVNNMEDASISLVDILVAHKNNK